MDGQQQRRALSAAEQALSALERADGDKAVRAAGEAVALDQVGAFAGFDDAVALAVEEIAATGAVGAATWGGLAQLLGPGPLGARAAERAVD